MLPVCGQTAQRPHRVASAEVVGTFGQLLTRAGWQGSVRLKSQYVPYQPKP